MPNQARFAKHTEVTCRAYARQGKPDASALRAVDLGFVYQRALPAELT